MYVLKCISLLKLNFCAKISPAKMILSVVESSTNCELLPSQLSISQVSDTVNYLGGGGRLRLRLKSF